MTLRAEQIMIRISNIIRNACTPFGSTQSETEQLLIPVTQSGSANCICLIMNMMELMVSKQHPLKQL